MRYKMVLSYSGAGFCGWQKQPGVSTVQETVENALYALLGTPTPVVGAGRTDTEVSAAGYVLHFDAPSELDTHRLRYKLNAILPRSVAVSSVSPAAEDFHARFGAVRREYTYFLHREKDPFADGWSFLFSYAGLDFDLMNRAAAMLLGTHDFSCFQKSGSDNKTTVCTVYDAAWHPYTPTHVALFGLAPADDPASAALSGPSPVAATPSGILFGGTQEIGIATGNTPACGTQAGGTSGTLFGGSPESVTSPPICGQSNQHLADNQTLHPAATNAGQQQLSGRQEVLGEAGQQQLSGRQEVLGEAGRKVLQPGPAQYWYFRITADRFLRNMVRAIVGTLLEVGRGKRPLTADDARPGCTITPFAELLDGGPRTASGESAPGYALFLSRVEY